MKWTGAGAGAGICAGAVYNVQCAMCSVLPATEYFAKMAKHVSSNQQNHVNFCTKPMKWAQNKTLTVFNP